MTQAFDWLQGIRDSAGARFDELGFPTTKLESWRNTDVRRIAETTFAVPGSNSVNLAQVESARLAELKGPRLVFINGIFSPKLSSNTSEDVAAGSLRDLPHELRPHVADYAQFDDNAFVALNTKSFEDGAWVRVRKDGVPPHPIHLLFLAKPGDKPIACHTRVLVVVEEGASAKFVEEYAGLGDDPYFTNSVTEFVIGENAQVDHCKVQRESPAAYHVATIAAHQDRNSRLSTNSLSMGGAITRNDIEVTLDGEGSEVEMDGLYHVRGDQFVDHHTKIDHRKPHTTSRELYKGILNDRARGVFNGLVVVAKDAQKVDAQQENRNLLLSKQALVNSNPQLLIYADDVKCRHGSTIGQLDSDPLFYLRSRGIDETEARAVLTFAFASEMVERIAVEEIRTAVKFNLHREMFHADERIARAGN